MKPRVLDLSMLINEQTPVYPGDPKPKIEIAASIEKEGWNEKRLTISSHFATHIDAPFHMNALGKKLDEYPIERFVGSAIVIDARGHNPIQPDLSPVRANDFVFFYTGQTEVMYSEKFYENNPVIDLKTAGELCNKKVSVVGIDSFSPDNPPFETHKLLFEHDIRIVENLVNLKPLVGKRFECFILPLRIENADGAPCRVIARI